MRVVAIAAFLLSGIPLAAQSLPLSTGKASEGPTIVCSEKPQADGKLGNGGNATVCTTTSAPQGCPVDMRVRQRMGGGTVAVDENGVARKLFAQRLRLILNSLQPAGSGQKAISASVTVHGTGGEARMRPLGSSGSNNWDLHLGSMVRTFRVDLVDSGDQGVSGDFLLPGFTSAGQVDLESVTYEDGTTWKLSRNEACRVAPDPVMLIGR